jgi:glutamate formiminotransferase
VITSVPNVSEGRRTDVVHALARAAGRHAHLLHTDPGWDANRTVLTLRDGPGSDLVEANVALAKAAMERIDLRTHTGIHVRMGAIDVIPFVPNDGDYDACFAMADRLARRLGDLGLPVWRYGIGSRSLREVRRSGFEELPETMKRIPPDFGPREPHPTAGAVAVGVRDVLIAFNVCLATEDVGVARQVARKIRESSGGLRGVLALGWHTPSFGCAQVSMNLVNWRVTPPHVVYEAIAELAPVAGSELVGMIPIGPIEAAAEHWGCDPEGAVDRLGLRRVRPFSLTERVLEYAR